MLPLRLLCALALLTASALFAADSSSPLSQRIDQIIAAPADIPLADDAEFLRRVTLDLTGTIPTATDARTFFVDNAVDKREKLIDKLLASPEHARHLAIVFDVLLMDRRAATHVPAVGWHEFLRESFATNKPYDQLVREILASDGTDAKTRPAARFVLDRQADSLQLTRDISRLFLGRNIQCAQCHDHPQIDDYKQQHFYGIQAFLNRSAVFPDAKGATIAEKAEGDVNFSSVFDKSKTIRMTGPKLLTLPAVMEPKLEKGKEYKVVPAKGVRHIPTFSRREQLPGVLTSTNNPSFARTAVNRLWALLMGRGLIHPLDMDHSDNPPSHPELLDALTKEFVDHKYDVRHLLGVIAKSKAYQRTSIVPANMQQVEPEKFFVAALKPLTPEQFCFSLMQATGVTDSERLALAKTLTEPILYARISPNLGSFVSMFGKQPGQPDDGNFNSTLEQTLFLRNGNVVRSWLPARNGNLCDRVLKLADVNAQVDELFVSVFTRKPTDEERKEVTALLQSPGADRGAQVSEIIWALITSAEFRFNH